MCIYIYIRDHIEVRGAAEKQKIFSSKKLQPLNARICADCTRHPAKTGKDPTSQKAPEGRRVARKAGNLLELLDKASFCLPGCIAAASRRSFVVNVFSFYRNLTPS